MSSVEFKKKKNGVCVLFITSKQCFYVSFIVVSQRAQSEKPIPHFQKQIIENKFTLHNLTLIQCVISLSDCCQNLIFQILTIVSQTNTNNTLYQSLQ